MTDTSKTAKIIKRWYYSTAHWWWVISAKIFSATENLPIKCC